MHLLSSPLHGFMLLLNEAMEWLDFISSGTPFHRILTLKRTEFDTFKTVLAFGSLINLLLWDHESSPSSWIDPK